MARRRMLSHFRSHLSQMAVGLLAMMISSFSIGDAEVMQEFEISEGVSVGTSIGFIGKPVPGSSHSPPPPPYLIVPSPGSAVDSDLTIDQSNGEILTRIQLDRETRDSYSLVAIPFVGENIRVTIRVKDENDHAPEFPTSFMTVEFPENTPRDVKRTLQPARDKDLGIYNTQRYTISAGNMNNAFRLSSHRERDGVLYLDLQVNGFLDRETTPSYSLQIEAFDGGVPPLKGTMTINITITDQNDNAPVFIVGNFPRVSNSDIYSPFGDSEDITLNQSRYFGTIPENASIGTGVVQVFATDIDEGPNGAVTYSINRRQTDKDSVFRIDKNTGMISVNGPLDYETKEAYELVIIARDSGIQPLETTVFVTIRVLDLNDNQMEINVSFFSGESDDSPPKVSEKALAGEFVARISIIDPDTKQEYNNVSILLEGGEGYFGLETVNSAVYLVVGSKKLDRENKPSFSLMVVAKDKSNPYLNASSKFTIYVEDDNDTPPTFEVEEYHASVLEMAETGSVVIQVKARDEDSGENARILYELVSSPETHSNWFEINEESGVITTKSHVDCEIDPTPILTVLAKDHGKPPLTGSATVVVHLIDINDTPIFNQGFYNASVLETAPYGTCLLKVSASDPDCGINAELSYNVLDSAPSELPFSVNSKSGEICVSGPLDYEKKHVYQILVSASDTGGLSSTAVVNIQLIDENDNVPIFYPRSFSITVKEGPVLPSSPIVAVSATDSDSSKFGQITYSFVEGNEEGIFSINKNTGEISMIRESSSKSKKSYRLRVTARDGDNQVADQTAEVTVHMIGSNFQAPIFQKPRYIFTIPEDLNVQSSVGAVSASGTGRVRYSIVSGDSKAYFTVDQYTGNIKVGAKLDHEEHPRFLLNVQAKLDQHEVISYCQVEIRVSDTNDNNPRFFASGEIKIWIPETAEVGSIVYVASALDKDSGANGEISYNLVQNPFGMFKIDKSQGLLTLQRPLDYETMKEFGIVIKARDNGTPAKSSESLTLHVEVQDANDNAPVWFKKRHIFRVKEKSPSGTFVGRLTKQDKNQNGAIKFQMQPTNEEFQIDADSGIISTTTSLFRNVTTHELTIVAYNQIPSMIKAEFYVLVYVVDANSRNKMPMADDNGIMQYHVNITESLPVNAEIIQVIALDEDSGNNARVSYKIEESPLQNVVGVFPSTGIVYLKELVDREIQDEFIVKIIATDHGLPPLSSTATVHIKVMDENDNAPVFEREIFKFTMSENNEPGIVVGHVTAHDRDMSGENSAIRYFLQPQHPDFAIDEVKGTISAKSSLDREKQSMYELQAVAIDQGHPPQQSEVIVQIILIDDNDNDPLIVEPDQDSITIRERLPIGTEVAVIVAIDSDEGKNARISYFLSNDDFEIDKDTGSLKTKRILSKSSRTFYNLQVRARDHGSPARESIRDYRVEVVDLTDKRSESLFVPAKLRFKVYENATVGTAVGKIPISTDLTYGKPQVFYQIFGGEAAEFFDIHATSGSLVVASKLDYEKVTRHIIKVKATLQTPISFSESVVTVEVDVLDVNDERPQFGEDPIVFNLSENTSVTSPIWNFTAKDSDPGLNGVLHYWISSQEPHSKFRLNMLTGTLYLQSSLDYETCSSYVLVVTATDQALRVEDRLNTSVTVNIIVQDENDNSPIFSSSSNVEMYELEPLKSEFHTVIAKDLDSSKYGQVSYKILSGNDEGIFHLHQDNGRLSLSKPLKRDVKRYSLNISAFDHGSPPKSVSQLLSITVKADKSHAPKFSHKKYDAKIIENCVLGSQVVTVTASNGESVFVILEGQGDGKFAIHPTTGIITVISAIDRESRGEYSLVVYLQDSKQLYVYDTTIVEIHVLDDNDNSPLFHDSCADLTVPENNELGIIHVFTAEDPDLGKNGEVTFTIAAGNVENFFHVDLHSGKLTGRPLDRERRNQYNLIIIAQDQGSPSRKSTCNITIHVDDENDSPITFVRPTKSEEQILLRSVNHPSFQESGSGQSMYAASIPENVPIGTTVLKVLANDADIGVNSIIKYSLNNESHWHFTINNSTGAILTAGILDREKISSYVFEVAATDGGLYDSRSSTASVHLTVTDYNDNRPQFKENPMVVKIPTGTKSGQSIVQVVATDVDEGVNAEIKYSLDSSGSDFTINSQTGHVSCGKSLAADRGKVFHLKVVAEDHGFPALSSTALLVIQVGDMDSQQSLKFQQSIYQVTLLENYAAGKEVVRVTALRNDGRKSRIEYTIVGGNEDDAFEIIPSSGVIRVKDSSRLDRERQTMFKLVISGKSEGSQTQFGHTVVEVILTDVNDNFPHFTQDSYIASVWEGNTKGTFVTQVTATDNDEGANANIVYHIIDGNRDNAFLIEPPFSGIVKTNIVLDREILDEYRLTIIATDEGSPQMTGTCYLHVNVIDIQDQSPVFPPHSVIAVKETAPVGTLVTTMVANDVDTNPTLVYGFADQGNPEGMFSIGKYTGRVTLVKPLDFETVKTHTAKIQVSDTVHTAQTTLTVNVLDDNDHRPVFSQNVYRVIVSEGAKIGGRVGHVNATDQDSNENGEIKYSLQRPKGQKLGTRFLRIDQNSGIIYLNASVSYHRDKPFSQLVVIATDKGKPSLSSEATLWIEVRPSQSHILKFSQSKYRSTVSQSAKPGSTITQLSVERTDQLAKGLHYHFSIVSGNDGDYFTVNSHSGQVVLAKQLDKNSPTLYTLMISADCVNMEQCSSFTELTVEVTSQSQPGPIFDKLNYKVSVNEGKPVGSILLKLHASDSKANGTINYEITSGNDDNLVELNRKSGVLILKKSLDFDQVNNNYRVVVRAVEQDNFSSSKSWNFTMVDISIDDENDNEPKFLFPSYVGVVGENEPIGTTVCTVKATDGDKGIYGKLQYSILDGDGKDKFSIASSSGIVTTNAIFDYESKSRYYLIVRANDIGGKSSTAKLQVEIESKDEFSPQFVQKHYKFDVPRNAMPGHIIGRVEAIDQDRGPDGILTYILSKPNSNFGINATNGFLILRTVPNSNINATLAITASSGRNGSRFSQTTVEAVLGEALQELEVAASSTTDWVLGILVATLLLLFIICAVFLLIHMRNKRQSKKGKSDEFNSTNFDTLDYANNTTMRIGSSKQDSLYGSHYGNIMDLRNNDRRRMNNAISELSDQSNSASSGRGSAEEDGEEVEDEEICMINEGTLAAQRLRGLGPDEDDDDDNASQSSAKNTQEYLARLGIRPNIPEDHSLSLNTDNLHLYDDKNLGVDISALIYSQISDDLNHSVLTDNGGGDGSGSKSSVTYKNVPQPSVTGSLSSIVHNDEELAGSYNWDYLLDWGPQYQPLAHVFSEIAHLKEGSNRSEPTYCGILSNNISSSSSDKGSSHHNFQMGGGGGGGGSSVGGGVRGGGGGGGGGSSSGAPKRTGPLPPLPILPRSPIPNVTSFPSGPISPNFSAALSPLARPSISPLGGVTNNIRPSQMHENYRSGSDLSM